MDIASSLTALCDMLRSQTGTQVILGFPDDTEPGIYVWPCLLKENTGIRYRSPGTYPQGAKVRHVPDMDVYALIMVRPALTLDGLSKLEAVRHALINQPILDVAGKIIHIMICHLDIPTLSALFTAASLPLTICLCVVLSGVEDTTNTEAETGV